MPGRDGVVSPGLALALDAGDLALMVVNPKAAKRFAEALMTRTKSDAVDAAVLAEFALRAWRSRCASLHGA